MSGQGCVKASLGDAGWVSGKGFGEQGCGTGGFRYSDVEENMLVACQVDREQIGIADKHVEMEGYD